MALGKKLLSEKLPGGDKDKQPEISASPSNTHEQSNISFKQYDGLQGLSTATTTNLNRYQQGYSASDTVQQAQAYLDNLLNNKPGDYASKHTQQLNDLYGQIMNRDPFQYNLNEDMLYQQAKDQYMLTGQQAMMDAMAMSSALTGGYGSSYSATAGNQAYQQHLTALNNMVPEFYDRAYAQYQNEGADLYNRFALTQQMDQTDYDRWLAALDQWNADRAFGLDQYNTLYNQDYGAYSDALNYWSSLAAQENSNYWNSRNQAYATVMAMLEQSKMPSKDMLEAAGISQEDAKKWIEKAPAPAPAGSTPKKKTDTTITKLDLQAYLNNLLGGKTWG